MILNPLHWPTTGDGRVTCPVCSEHGWPTGDWVRQHAACAAGGTVPTDPPEPDERPIHLGNGFTVKCGLPQAGPMRVAGQWELVTCTDCLAERPTDPQETP